MQHVVTVADLLKVGLIIGIPVLIIFLIGWFLSTIDFSH
jgi:hypothetical protein